MKKINMPLQLEPLYVRAPDNPDDLFYFAMIVGTNMVAMHVPQPLINAVGCLWSQKWVEASKN